MATVTVEVHGRPYAVGCADGQEARVRDLAAQFNERVQGVADQVGQVGDVRLFLMAALMLADELQEAKRQAAVQNSGRAKAAAAAVAPAPVSEGVAEALNAVAARIEKITQTI
ncbi:cell division protein ZapA [Brevundimonas naejangsanensis]|uniref:cell division protein ZapA n=1 Tax=Brevundimonas naejangsanensis TaxID=588932 RepID=UPI003D05C9A7